ncbi:hypothetical protein [Microbacterium sp. YY-01]|uniref:hypothetical protein n=1 Tax=Microbacterium sp. YY-01 TaxID=3421634 RepID=UPI003D16318C
MYRVNGVPLDNPALGWILRAGTIPYSALEPALDVVKVNGRDGHTWLPTSLDAPFMSFKINTPPSGWEALLTLFNQPELVVTRDDMPDREIVCRLASSAPNRVYARNEWIDVTFVLEMPGVFWRSTAIDTFSTSVTANTTLELWGAGGVGGTVVASNVFTNPRFVGNGQRVEIRRNLWTDPLFGTTEPGGPTGGAGATPAPWTIYQRCEITKPANGVIHVTRVQTGGNAGPGTVVIPASAGMVVTISAKVENTNAWGRVRAIGFDSSSNSDVGSQVLGANATSGQWSEVTITIPAGADRLNFQLQVAGNVGDNATFSELQIELGSTRGSFFAPGIQSPDVDMQAAFVGEVGKSESVLTGEAVAGVTGWQAHAIRSAKFGGSLRLIPTNATSAAIGLITVPSSARFAGTAAVTLHLEQPLTNIVSQSATRRIRINTPPVQGGLSDAAPNEAGSWPLRTFWNQMPGSNYQMQLYAGNGLGGGDTYWTMGGIFPGVYQGDVFTGATPSTRLQVYAWASTPDGSASTKTVYTSWDGGLSAPVNDAVLRLRGPAESCLVTDSSGAWVSLPPVPANQYVRFDAKTGRAWQTTSDTWTGGTEVSGLVDFGGPRGWFEITPVLTSPDDRRGKLTVAGTGVSGATRLEVRGRAAYLQ